MAFSQIRCLLNTWIVPSPKVLKLQDCFVRNETIQNSLLCFYLQANTADIIINDEPQYKSTTVETHKNLTQFAPLQVIIVKALKTRDYIVNIIHSALLAEEMFFFLDNDQKIQTKFEIIECEIEARKVEIDRWNLFLEILEMISTLLGDCCIHLET